METNIHKYPNIRKDVSILKSIFLSIRQFLMCFLRCLDVLPQLKATKRCGILQNEIIAIGRCGWNEPQREREVFLELQAAGANTVCKHGRQ